MVKNKDMHYLIPTIKLDYIKNEHPASFIQRSLLHGLATSNN